MQMVLVRIRGFVLFAENSRNVVKYPNSLRRPYMLQSRSLNLKRCQGYSRLAGASLFEMLVFHSNAQDQKGDALFVVQIDPLFCRIKKYPTTQK
ncbi:hypothetical protein SAMN04487896_1101 [Paenibacillus sp. ov031]|nr:hypothetical protein SAMN05428961_1011087 [Paenibacillus sp. OK060]SHN57885.1 hypothetical protein SAMN04487896_1101 [Paenibacillus sp. ov031]